MKRRLLAFRIVLAFRIHKRPASSDDFVFIFLSDHSWPRFLIKYFPQVNNWQAQRSIFKIKLSYKRCNGISIISSNTSVSISFSSHSSSWYYTEKYWSNLNDKVIARLKHPQKNVEHRSHNELLCMSIDKAARLAEKCLIRFIYFRYVI